MTSAISRAGTFVVLAGLALVGCGVVPSPYRVNLYQTAWTVTALDGEPLAGTTTMSFNEDAVVTVRSTCGSTQLGVDLDSDGDSIEFWNLAPRPSACPATELAADAAFFDALEAVETWQVDDDDHIRLIGPKEIASTRMPGADSN